MAPPAMLFYCLIIRGGILDGWAGFYYAFQRGLAELMLSLYLIDHDLGNSDFEMKPHHRDTENTEGAPEKDVPKLETTEIRNS